MIHRSAAFILVFMVVLGLLAGRLLAATPSEYDRALGQVQASLASQAAAIEAEEIPSGQAPSLVAQSVLGPIHSVGSPGQVPLLVDTSQLIAAIHDAEAVKDPEQKSDAFEAVSEQISLLRRQLTTEPWKSNLGKTDPAQTLASARAVLARPEFASDPPPPPSLAERLAAWLDKIFNRPSPNTPNVNLPSVNPRIIEGIFIVIAAGAFAVLVAVIVQAIGRREARTRTLALDEEEAVLVEARDNDSLLALAEQQAKQGDYRRAFRLVYLASLVALDTGGVLRFDRSKTNWEYLRALRSEGRGDIYQTMTPLTREFDQIWYGFAPTDASHYARALAQYRSLVSAPTEAAVR